MTTENYAFTKAKINRDRLQTLRRGAITAVVTLGAGGLAMVVNHDVVRALIFSGLVGTFTWYFMDPSLTER